MDEKQHLEKMQRDRNKTVFRNIAHKQVVTAAVVEYFSLESYST